MKNYTSSQIKNIVLLGHPGSGKTSLAETMLFESGGSKRRGTVEEKNTVSDYSEIEHVRGYSITTSVVHSEWRDTKINILDAPGYDDFIGETIAAMRVAETGVMVINAQHGVEVGTEIHARKAKEENLPLLFAVNQIDHDKADFEKCVEQVKARFGHAVAVVQYPLNQGHGFDTIVDVLKMVVYKFSKTGGKPEKLPIPDSEKEKADRLHKELIENIAEHDETLMEHYFEKGELTEDEMRNGLKAAIMHREIFPLFVLSAKQNMGSGRLFGFIGNVCPSAADLPLPAVISGTALPCDSKAAPSVFIFKTVIEPHLGDLELFKVMSGEIKTGMELVNASNRSTERFSKLFILNGKERTETPSLVAGDIGATVKLKSSHSNHTLHEKNHPVEYAPIQLPEDKIQFALVVKSAADEDKAVSGLRQIHQEDPTLKVEQSHELRQIIVSGQGELHLAIAKWRLEHQHKIVVEFGKPRIPYRETIQKPANGHHKHKKQSGGAGQYGEVHMMVEPYHDGMPAPKGVSVRSEEKVKLPWGGSLVFLNCIVGGVIDTRFLPSIMKGVMEKMERGPLTGSYVRDVRVAVYDGSMHDVDSNDISFKIAGMKAFSNAFREANPKILEPVYEVEVHAPEDVMGEIMSDLQTRRSTILGMDSDGSYQLIKAHIPLSELYKYSTSLRSLSQGRAYHTLKFYDYLPVPFEVQEKLLNEHRKLEEVEA